MKRCLLTAAAVLALIMGCTAPLSQKNTPVIASFLPMQIFALNICENTDVAPMLLLPPSLGCPHDYALTPGDVERLARAECVIINGDMETFITPEKMKAINPSLRIIDASKGLARIEEEEGDHDHDHGHEGHAHDHDHGGVNPHQWVSPFVAAKQVRTIGKELALAYPSNRTMLLANAESYAKKLEALGSEMRSALAKMPSRKIITFHDAFDYFARDLGLTIVGVVEVDAGVAPSAKHIAELAALAKKHAVSAVFAEVQYPAAAAATVAKEAGLRVLTLDPVANGIEAKDYYDKTMRKNLFVLIDALK